MTIHHDKPVGVDIFFREIFAGDTVRDQDGKEYTIDERGWARPFDGSAGCGYLYLKEPVFVKAADKPEAPAKFQEKDGKVGPVVPVDVPKPRVRLAPIAKEFGFSTWQASKKVEEAGLPTFGKGGLIYIQEKDIPAVREALDLGCEPVAQLETQPEPAVEYREGPAPHKGGRVNKSGFSQLGNLAGRVGLSVNDARKICEDAGIEVIQHGPRHKACVRVEDLQKVRELLTKASGMEPAPSPGNNGNHRPNTTGFSSFANLARGLHAPAWELRDFAKAHDIVIVRPDKPHSNDGIYKEDEVRFRELWAVEHGSPAPAPEPPIPPIPPQLSQEALDAIKSKTLGQHIEIKPAIGRFGDQELADELRRRGYEVIAIKHVEL